MATVRLKSKDKDDPKERLQRLGDKLIDIEKKSRKLEEDNEDVFSLWRHLQEEAEGIRETMKVEARKISTEGQTSLLVDTKDLFVSVVGLKRPVIYAFDLANKYLSHDIVDRCRPRVLDSGVVESQIRAGVIDEKVAAKIREFGNLPTPRVTIKVG